MHTFGEWAGSPTTLGIAAGLGIWAASAWHPAAALAGLACSAWGVLAHRRHARHLQQVHAQHSSQRQGLQALGHELLPLWRQHLGASQGQMETAVTQLTHRFASIVDRLDQAMQASTLSSQAGTQEGVQVFQHSQTQLQAVLQALRASIDCNQQLHQQVQDLERYVQELQDMAAEVASIASQTNLLAINAAIEAAHAGEIGRGFSVLSQEVRKLAALSGATGQRMTQKVTAITQAISHTRLQAADTAAQQTASLTASQDSVEQVLTRFQGLTGQLTDAAQLLQDESRGIQSEIVQSLVQLQFQDRVSQMMGHVGDSLQQLGAQLQSAQGLDIPHLLATLESTYAMAEERQAHAAQRGQAAPPTLAHDSDAVTFF